MDRFWQCLIELVGRSFVACDVPDVLHIFLCFLFGLVRSYICIDGAFSVVCTCPCHSLGFEVLRLA